MAIGKRNPGPNDLVRVSEAARLLGVSLDRLYRAIHTGRVRASRLGPKSTRIAWADAEALAGLLGTAEVSARLDVHPVTVALWARTGRLKAEPRRRGQPLRFRLEEVERLLGGDVAGLDPQAAREARASVDLDGCTQYDPAAELRARLAEQAMRAEAEASARLAGAAIEADPDFDPGAEPEDLGDAGAP